MRTICALVLFGLAAGCAGSDTLDNTAYRRLVDTYDTNDQCLAEGNFAQCYQTLTFCADQHVNANLAYRQQGMYSLNNSDVIAKLPTVTVVFDLENATSNQLPGRHPWELVTPLYYDCTP